MPSIRSTLIAGAVVNALGLGLFSSMPSEAQPAPGLPGSPAFMAPDGPPRPSCAELQAVLAGKLAYLEARLAFQPEQVDAWQAFVRDVRSAVVPLDDLCRARQSEDAGPPGAMAALAGDPIGVIEARQKPLVAMQAAVSRFKEAARGLNEVLDPAQRQAFAKALFLDGPGLPPPGSPGAFGAGPHGMHPPLMPR